MSVILGIDPGSRFCGYGLIKTNGSKLEYLRSGVIKTGAKSFPERLHIIFSNIVEIIEEIVLIYPVEIYKTIGSIYSWTMSDTNANV